MAPRRLTVDLFTTLDGYAGSEDAPAYFGYLGPELERWIDRELDQPQLMLMGRVTYEQLAMISAAREYEDANRMAGMPKIVFSNTLDEPLSWENTRDPIGTTDPPAVLRGEGEEA
jgi:dihydrofolate reductase